MPASKLRGSPTQFQESHGFLSVWNRELWREFSVFSAPLEVFDDLMSASVRDASPEGRVARTSQKCRCDFRIPRNEVGGVRWLLPRGKRHDSRSTFHVSCCSLCRNHCSQGRLLIRSENLALVPALYWRRCYIAFRHAPNLCVWFPGRFCLTVQVDTDRFEVFRQGKPSL